MNRMFSKQPIDLSHAIFFKGAKDISSKFGTPNEFEVLGSVKAGDYNMTADWYIVYETPLGVLCAEYAGDEASTDMPIRRCHLNTTTILKLRGKLPENASDVEIANDINALVHLSVESGWECYVDQFAEHVSEDDLGLCELGFYIGAGSIVKQIQDVIEFIAAGKTDKTLAEYLDRVTEEVNAVSDISNMNLY